MKKIIMVYILLSVLINLSCSKKIITYHKNGEIKAIIRLNKNKELNGLLESFYDNGQKESICNYRKGVECNGVEITWYTNGQLKTKGYYNNQCESEGKYEEWFSNGNYKRVGYYKNGKIDALWLYYDSLGSLKKREVWEKGILLDSLIR